MLKRLVVGVLGGASWLLVASPSHAECTKDIDCAGDNVCEAGNCVAPSLAPPPPVAAPAIAPAAAPAIASAPQPPVARELGPEGSVLSERSAVSVEKRHHSKGMMVGGIVMTSFVPVAALVALIAGLDQSFCNIDYAYDTSSDGYRSTKHCNDNSGIVYGSLLVGAGLAGAGIPMIVIGAKREPVVTASVTPWATPNAGGLRLRFDL